MDYAVASLSCDIRLASFLDNGYAPIWWQARSVSAAVFGDSISGGYPEYNSPEDPAGESGDVTYSPAYQLWELYPTEFTYRNFGVNGTTVAAAHYASVVSAAPVIAILHSGINDITESHTWLGNIRPGLNTIIAAMNSADIYLFVDEILPCNLSDDAKSLSIRTINTQIADWCAANGATRILCHDAMGQTRASTGQLDDLIPAYQVDGVHLSRAGYAFLVSLWKAAIEAHF